MNFIAITYFNEYNVSVDFVKKGFVDLKFCFFCFKTKEIAEGKIVKYYKQK